MELAKAVYKGGGKDLAVNVGGLAGSKIGALAGGGLISKAGQLGGDWAGARIARRILNDTEAVVKARKIRNNPAFQAQPKNIQNQILRKRSIGYSRSINKNQSELGNDTLGWGIGNSAAESLQKAGSNIPLQGGGVAIATMPTTMRSIKLGQRVARSSRASGTGRLESAGIGFRKGLIRNNRRLGRNLAPRNVIRLGNQREDLARNRINAQLQQMPRLPVGTSFKNGKKLIKFNYN
jgi:uncharacterized protein YcfJ